jgi:peptidoglycan hydrolase-like protein with peptidoglycan-binding domain
MNPKITSSVTASMLALAVLTTALPAPVAHAQSNTDLQTQIAALLAQISQLQSQLGNGSSMQSYTFVRNLKIGDTGEDVRMLQRLLNQSADTQVSLSGAGSVGNETTYFGPATAAAVSKFQVKYRADILAPAGLQNPTGFFGPSSIKKANALSSAVVVTPPVVKPTKPTTPDKPVVENEGTILKGNGDLKTFEIDSVSDSDIHEAAADAEIAELTFESKNGDLELSRMDIALVADSGNDERDPWDVFETISLWVDGKKVAEQKIDSKNAYLNKTAGTIRFSNLKIVLEEDEELEMTVAVSVQNGVKGAGTNADWSVSVNALRCFDAEKVSNDDSSTGDLKKATAFSIVERGEGEELKFSIGSQSPIEKTVVVDSKKKTTNVTILEYTIEALDNDIELDRLYVNVQTGTAAYADVISDIRLKVGGKTFKKDTIVSTGSYTANSVLVSFDIDNKVTIDEDDKEDVSVIVDFKAKTAYSNGESVWAQVTSAERDITKAEGADDVKKFSGSVVGKEQILISEGMFSPASGARFAVDTQGSNDTIGIFTAEFEVTAVEGDFYISEYASSTSDNSTGGVQFTVDTTAGTPTSVSASLSSTAKENTTGVFVVREGQTETFTLTVVVDAAVAGNHRITVDTLYFSENTDGVTGSVVYSMKPSAKFKSPYKFINN